MSYESKDLSVLAYATGFTLWYYKSEAPVDIFTEEFNYFGEAADILRVGDMLIASVANTTHICTVHSISADKHVVITRLV